MTGTRGALKRSLMFSGLLMTNIMATESTEKTRKEITAIEVFQCHSVDSVAIKKYRYSA
jgi:hypothetical protein